MHNPHLSELENEILLELEKGTPSESLPTKLGVTEIECKKAFNKIAQLYEDGDLYSEQAKNRMPAQIDWENYGYVSLIVLDTDDTCLVFWRDKFRGRYPQSALAPKIYKAWWLNSPVVLPIDKIHFFNGVPTDADIDWS